MAKQLTNNIKLGLFVILGLAFLVVMLYFIGKNTNIFTPSFTLRTHFQHIQGLQKGNNVRFSGIQIGSIRSIDILNDTVIEVTMSIDNDFKNIIKKNALVSIGTDGVVGNKIVNIVPVKMPASLVVDQDLLVSKKPIDSDEMLVYLSKTNRNIADITENLKITLQALNENQRLMHLLSSDEIPDLVSSTLREFKQASSEINYSAHAVHQIIDSVQFGSGNLSALIYDTTIFVQLRQASTSIKEFGEKTNVIAKEVDQIINSLDRDLQKGNGPVQALLRDSAWVSSINSTLDNLNKGTASFDQNMEALKSNFLFRGYFKKQARKEAKQNQKK
ncbi:MAG: MCE family protein [Saprospiraceae bacterium]|nr:MCE family protein [Saprospiraceae bacterium]